MTHPALSSDIAWSLFQLNKLRGVGPAALQRLAGVSESPFGSLEELGSRDRASAKAIQPAGALDAAADAAQKDADQAIAAGARILCPFDAEYPQLLARVSNRPFFLYVLGNLALARTRAVAVIGTRQPTAHGQVIAQRLSAHLARDDWSIVSGLALGCDAVAHKAALAEGGHTVAVLAHGLQTIAPKQHAGLAEEILRSGGALLSEYPFGTEPAPHQFVARDRTQAAMAAGVIMVQSDLNGGSLHASRAAIELGRVLAVPVPTAADIGRDEPKIQANRVLTGNDPAAIAALLKRQPLEVDAVMSIRGREDYAELQERLVAVTVAK